MAEFCQWEKFNASCGADELILMTSARYGRMKLGRCLNTDYFVGCSADVLSHVDTRCSGRPKCVINIPDPDLFNVQPCRKDLVAYFSASFICLKVQMGDHHGCQGRPFTDLPPVGYLASYVTDLTGLGSPACPWRIKVLPGQRINVSLYDFSSWAVAQSEAVSMTARACHIVGKVRENGRETELRACVGYERLRQVYQSTNEELDIEVDKPITARAGGYYMLKYEASGCPDMRASPDIRVQRRGDVLMVNCRYTSQTWHLVCTGTSWAGEIGNCTKDGHISSPSNHLHDNPETLPYGLIIAIGIGAILGIILGLVFLIGVLICKRRQRRIERNKEKTATYVCREATYGEHPDVSYKLMEIRQHRAAASVAHQLADPRTGGTLLAKQKRLGEQFYERPIFELNETAPAIKLDCENNCQSCIYEKTPYHMFDLIRHDETMARTGVASGVTPPQPPDPLVARSLSAPSSAGEQATTIDLQNNR